MDSTLHNGDLGFLGVPLTLGLILEASVSSIELSSWIIASAELAPLSVGGTMTAVGIGTSSAAASTGLALLRQDAETVAIGSGVVRLQPDLRSPRAFHKLEMLTRQPMTMQSPNMDPMAIPAIIPASVFLPPPPPPPEIVGFGSGAE